ncbi:M56 family metallopeptidase [Dyadobacter chenwenxiniae]|uniref:M56 family metallopeptidase n=1 Tax=Dyadobacter chenwenxiniae TaxID=2906456 RepID=A0A9X1PK23_9BACT|nr:M56 family metallopeptidase [Dyadobacter chenwenxiniae]MCF0062363.1 M56 family metallopeptidase [Dyadobacter chenwenxiniae]UON83882.1 M56 family metallopeptidase [Dyadobacter chenwenxiniae]
MNFNELYFQKLVQALSLTLIHSLWQGLIAAVIAGTILMLTKKAKPALRYNLLATLLFALVLTSAYTFASLLFSENEFVNNHLSNSESVRFAVAGKVSISEKIAFAGSDNRVWISYLMDFCSSQAQVIATIWFVVFSFKSFQATAGFLYLQKVKKHNAHPLRESWRLRFDILAKKMKISQAIQVIESEHVLVPMVIGFLKPMVIIPFGIFINLPETQIEAIVLHELAHIKRRDYVVNLMQIFCENIFFFNPALLWLSSLIREEREHCCDDLAISVMENKTSFVHALVSFQEYHVTGSAFEMAFSRNRNHLLDRIKRIIYNNNKPLNAMEKLFVTFSLLTAVALSATISQEAPQPALVKVVSATVSSKPKVEPARDLPAERKVIAVVNQDTLPKKKKLQKPVTVQSKDVEVNENVSINTDANSHSQVNISSNGVSTFKVYVNDKGYEW